MKGDITTNQNHDKRMEVFEFAAERQYIFKVEIDNIPRLVSFGDKYGSGASMFQTKDPKVAEAIRRTSMFRRGAIKETTHPEPKKVKGSANGTAAKGKETTKKKEPELEEKVFTNITQAKDWVSKEYKIPKTQLRKPETVVAEAKKHKVRLIIKAIEA